MILEWSPLALGDRNAIFDYIEADSPRAAIDIDDRIRAAAERLIKFPAAGRPGRVEETRELIIPHMPYIAVYRVTGGTIRILRVLHGAQQWP
ncbi:MAG: type II toxin-antitoxin system RelE/ParE family toxin [Terriglobales bacterium]